MRKLVIDGIEITDDSDCYVIAEIGHNHQGSLDQCKKLFKAAKAAGADCVKLQKRNNRALFTKDIYDAPYNSENAYAATYGAHREFLEFGRDEYVALQKYAKELEITFTSTAFDFPSADFLAELDMPAYKMASGDVTNIPLLKYVAKLGKPMVMSTGGATLDEVRRAYDAIMPINTQLCIMQCTSGYPPTFEELNLKVIQTLRETFPDIVIGFSAHDSGIAMSLAGFMLGARIVEKHFTLNRALKGTDHSFSLEPHGLEKMIRDLKRARLAFGDGVKRRYPTEDAPLFKMAKKIVAARDLPAGHIITEQDLAYKCPADGLPPYMYDQVVGKRLVTALKEDQNVELGDLA
jgi:sialic acid synthase